MGHPVTVDEAFKRRLAKKPAKVQAAIYECIKQLSDNTRHPGLRTSRLTGHAGVYYARIDKANRLTFHWDGEMLVLRNHCNHDVLKKNP